MLLNDDYTPMDFVVTVLQHFFSMDWKKPPVMLNVHTRGRGVRVFTREVAESKVACVNEFSRMNQHPLLCTMEKAGNTPFDGAAGRWPFPAPMPVHEGKSAGDRQGAGRLQSVDDVAITGGQPMLAVSGA